MLMKLPGDVLKEIAARERMRRKDMRLSQEILATRSGVSLGSIKRFEGTGKISLESLLKLAITLGTLKDFDTLFSEKMGENFSLDDILNKQRNHGKRKAS